MTATVAYWISIRLEALIAARCHMRRCNGPACMKNVKLRPVQRALGILVPLPYSVIVPSNVPAVTLSPSLKRISDSTPVADAGTSTVVPSVSISTSGSLRLTGSPTRLNHRPIDALAADVAIFGTRISVAMKAILWGSMPCDLVSICAGNYLPAIVFSHVFRHKIRRTDFQILKRGLATCSPARFEAIMSTADKKRARSQPKDQNRKVGIQFRHR